MFSKALIIVTLLRKAAIHTRHLVLVHGEGAARHLNLDWPAVPGICEYAAGEKYGRVLRPAAKNERAQAPCGDFCFGVHN